MPLGPPVRLTELPSQTGPLLLAFATGNGLTVTVTYCVLGTPPTVIIIVYVTLIDELVVFVSTSLIVAVLPEDPGCVIPAIVGLDHE